MRHRQLAICFAFLVTVGGAARASAQQPSPFDFDAAWSAVVARLHGLCEQHAVVGGSLLFVRGAEELGFAAHGLADRSAGRAVDRETIFHWASCTKTLTGIAAMQLRDRGLLRLEQPVVDRIPELREVHDAFGRVDEILIRHLMTHSAGFRAATFPWGGDQPWHPHEPTRWSQLAAMLPYTAIEFAPGSKFAYSNPGIVFLGRTIEAISGDDYEVYMDKNVLRPLGMARSYFDGTPWHLQRHRSHSYAVGPGGAVVDHGADFDTGITVSNGGLNAPLPDMARYLAFLLGSATGDAAAVLARPTLESMWEPVLPIAAGADDHIGLCFFVRRRGGSAFVGHTGGQRDFVSFFYVHPASGTGACGAFNTSTAGAVLQELQTMCMESLSLPMTPRDGDGDGVAWRSYRLRLLAARGDQRPLVVTVPSGGHELAFERAVRDGDTVTVELKLTTPGAEEGATAALEDHEVALPTRDLIGAATLRIAIATWQRGAHYLVAPAHEPAATFPLR